MSSTVRTCSQVFLELWTDDGRQYRGNRFGARRSFWGIPSRIGLCDTGVQASEEILPEIGVKARLEIPGESDVEVTVMRTTEDTVVIDGNHPLHSQRLRCLVHLYERWEEEDDDDE